MKQRTFLALSGIVSIGIAIAGVAFWNSSTRDQSYSSPQRSKRELQALCDQKITDAESKARRAIHANAEALRTFVHSRKGGAKPFAESVVSLKGKWKALVSHLPLTDKTAHRKFVGEAFAKNIFSEAELADVIRQSVLGAIKDLESTENELAVQIRQEILGRNLRPDEAPIASQEFETAIKTIVQAAEWDATKTAGNFVAAELAAQVGTQVMVRLGVSAGILATGAATSWWTMGAGLVVGVVADAVWEWIDNPVGDIENEVSKALDALGTNGAESIESEMNKVLEARREGWRKAADKLINET